MRLDDNQKTKTVQKQLQAALIAAIILLTPAKVFAIHINVPAAQRKLQNSYRVQRQIVVSLPDRQLALLEDGQVVKVYSVAVGAEVSQSPEGNFTVINRLEKPTYYAPGKVIVPGKNNPLGTRWMGLSKKGYGIHGTNMPKSIGTAASHGCIRMRQRDLEELFTMVRVGDKVQFRDMQMTALLTPAQAPLQAQPSDVQTAMGANANSNMNANLVVTTNVALAAVAADGTDQF